MKQDIQQINNLLDFIHQSPSSFHVIKNIKAELNKSGFKELTMTEKWKIEKNKGYYITVNDSGAILIKTGSEEISTTGFNIIAAHTDAPCLKIKPTPEIIVDGSYLKLNVEVYGGPILNTWFDRPLAIGGRVSLKSSNPLKPEVKFVHINRPLMIIPNLAIHFNRQVNDGVKIDNQKHLNPLISMVKQNFEKNNYLLKLIASELKIKPELILDFELGLAEYEKGSIIGANNEFISSGKLDNLSMIFAGKEALLKVKNNTKTNIVLCFDNEEVGSLSKQGAQSGFYNHVLQRLVLAANNDYDLYIRTLYKSFMISADMAHAIHPNYAEMHDPTNHPIINKGPVIKINANQKYTTDSNSGAIFEMLCQKADVPVQRFVNRSDLAGGSTLGSIAATHIPVPSVDVGNPLLAMHSIRELAGVDDFYLMEKVFEEFFKCR